MWAHADGVRMLLLLPAEYIAASCVCLEVHGSSRVQNLPVLPCYIKSCRTGEGNRPPGIDSPAYSEASKGRSSNVESVRSLELLMSLDISSMRATDGICDGFVKPANGARNARHRKGAIGSTDGSTWCCSSNGSLVENRASKNDKCGES